MCPGLLVIEGVPGCSQEHLFIQACISVLDAFGRSVLCHLHQLYTHRKGPSGYRYSLMSSSLTAEGVNTPRSVNSRVIKEGEV